jgi:hypothetical protein
MRLRECGVVVVVIVVVIVVVVIVVVVVSVTSVVEDTWVVSAMEVVVDDSG